MKKLEHDIVLTIPEEILKEAQKECSDIPIIGKVTMEIYHDYEHDDEEWEVYCIRVSELGDEFDIRIAKEAMDLSRIIEKQGGGCIEEFIYEMVMKMLRHDAEEREARDFFEDISD